jgi:hypothetical protein
MTRMPSPIIDFRESGVSIADLISERHGYSSADYPWAKHMLGKFPIPKWQRESVWTKSQKVALIKSVYLGYDIGSVVINGYDELSGGRLAPFSDALIDGQQRIETFLEYTRDGFAVWDMKWSQLDRKDKSRFVNRQMGKRMTNCFDEARLKEVYNHLNFAGTAHEESERA